MAWLLPRRVLNREEILPIEGLGRRIQQRDFVFGQVKQVVDDALDPGFGLGDFGAQTQGFGAVAIDPVFPIGTIGKGDIGLEDLFHLGAEGREVWHASPFPKLVDQLEGPARRAEVRDAAGQDSLQLQPLSRPVATPFNLRGKRVSGSFGRAWNGYFFNISVLFSAMTALGQRGERRQNKPEDFGVQYRHQEWIVSIYE
ncbi:hypothetical protein [Salipiger aestuarii]|uniref:hypothetical protein n=1 Tax=Salipiger aestuarii TaxID=568098 RepID=UPI0012398D71|nr:hypothetical protein [Salipiger aestuarii]